MKKHKLLLFLLLIFFACNDNEMPFEASTEGLKLEYRSMPGGAMLKYKLPNNSDIFAMNIRYVDNRGGAVLKSCGYGGDSILLDGFTKSQKFSAQISFLDNYGNETKSFDYEFSTEDSVPWSFFDKLKISTSWKGFKVVYGKVDNATGMTHIFYLGINPKTQKKDTILVSSFPINSKGDTLNLVIKQENVTNTIIVRTEDFAGYRVRQEVFPDIESFNYEQMTLTEENFDDGGLSVDSKIAQTGVKYLFDRELKGRERFLESKGLLEPYKYIFQSYVAGPQAFGKPFIIDLKEEKIPAKMRFYSLYERITVAPAGPNAELGTVWNGYYNDKLPCNVSFYGTNDPLAPKDKWVELGTLNEDPTIETPWYTMPPSPRPIDIEDFDNRDPLFVDIYFPPINNAYRYIIFVVNDTFRVKGSVINYNLNKYFTLIELEIFVKKD